MDRFLGVDACRAGWVGVALGEGTTAYFGKAIAELVARAEADGELGLIAVDMPIGLPDEGYRDADVLAVKRVGTLRSSVFPTPTRTALELDTHAEVSAANVANGGKGVSRQAFALKAKLFEVDAWVRETPHEVVEGHPEVSFATLNGEPLVAGKKTWAGSKTRHRLLAGAGIRLADDLGDAGRNAHVDDVLDAAVLAWTARRVALGEAICLPEEPQVFSDGLRCAIWA